ncbi:response regulator [Ornithinimicrobium murale]|uniref:response regulator n=1 Tax=Ornithinimicrobium murale TaxID=1050153 RepID=UPI001EDDC8BC|nr:response regulator transcription factor [Ornithinimicrobium murale]
MTGEADDVVTGEPLSVVLADDHARLRARVRAALETAECVVLGEAATADQAVALVAEHGPQVALLDINMPGDGIAAARRISTSHPGTAVVMLTQSEEDEDLFDSLRAGASGYLLKDGDPAGLAQALHGVLRGEAALAPSLVSRVLQEFRTSRPRRSAAAARLTNRELQVMELLAAGASTAEVASELFLSTTTVRVHVSSVLRKLRVTNRENAFRVLRGR